MASKLMVVAVGHNTCGQLATVDDTALMELTQILGDKSNIARCHCGFQFAIYADELYTNIFTSGSNNSYQCGHNNEPKQTITAIKYFDDNDIKIDKICANPAGESAFWITNDGKVYGTGLNSAGELGVGNNENKVYPRLITQFTTRYRCSIR